MEGELKVVDYILLERDYPKGFFFGIVMLFTLVGLLLILYYKKLRAALFYSEVPLDELSTATHIYIEGSDEVEEICELMEETMEGVKKHIFIFRHLKY